MNRELKFRAWEKILGYMSIPFGIWESKPFGLAEFGKELTDVANPDDYVLMQYTGLKDKNDIEIYARDIIEKGGLRFEVLFDNGSFIIMREKRKHMDYLLGNASSAEVIGNVWENPELLKKEK